MLDVTSFEETLSRGAATLNIGLSPDMMDQYVRLTRWLLEWNQRMNLTAVRDPGDVAVKHLLDSLTCLVAYPFPQGAHVIDVGTGAGFPGLALKIARPDVRLTLLDSTRKKLAFVDFVAQEMQWADVRILSARAEDAGRDPIHREQYDVAVARAVAALRILSEFCLPFVRVGGAFLAMKGPAVSDELALARGALERLGGEAGPAAPFTLPFEGGERSILVVHKARATPPELPRIYRDIKRQPL